MVNFSWHEVQLEVSGNILGKNTSILGRKGKENLIALQLIRFGEDKKKTQKTWGGNSKIKLFSTNFINVTDPNTNKTSKVRILGFDSNAASKDLNRRHILTKGAVVETELGNARITSRPGQHGTLNGILMSS